MLLKDIRAPSQDRIFEQHLMKRATWIRSIIVDSQQKIWVATSNNLSVYNKSYQIIMQHTPYNDKVRFFGHFRILWTDAKSRFIFWWCDRGSIKVFCAKSMKLVSKYKNMLKNPEERPNHYTFLDGDFRKIFFVTNHLHNTGTYYVLDVLCRKVYGGDQCLPHSENSMIVFAHICVAYNCPSDCIVTTGISSLVGKGDASQLESKAEISHISVFKLLQNNKVQLIDSQLNAEMKLMTIASIVFHTPNHTRILSVLTKHVFVFDLINGKLQSLFQIRDQNRGECVHQIVRCEHSYLFVGNFGQIFKIVFKDRFFNSEDMPGKDDPAVIGEDRMIEDDNSKTFRPSTYVDKPGLIDIDEEEGMVSDPNPTLSNKVQQNVSIMPKLTSDCLPPHPVEEQTAGLQETFNKKVQNPKSTNQQSTPKENLKTTIESKDHKMGSRSGNKQPNSLSKPYDANDKQALQSIGVSGTSVNLNQTNGTLSTFSLPKDRAEPTISSHNNQNLKKQSQGPIGYNLQSKQSLNGIKQVESGSFHGGHFSPSMEMSSSLVEGDQHGMWDQMPSSYNREGNAVWNYNQGAQNQMNSRVANTVDNSQHAYQYPQQFEGNPYPYYPLPQSSGSKKKAPIYGPNNAEENDIMYQGNSSPSEPGYPMLNHPSSQTNQHYQTNQKKPRDGQHKKPK